MRGTAGQGTEDPEKKGKWAGAGLGPGSGEPGSGAKVEMVPKNPVIKVNNILMQYFLKNQIGKRGPARQLLVFINKV